MRWRSLCAGAAVALLAVACGGDDPGPASPRTNPSPVASPLPSAGTSATDVSGASSPDDAALGFYGAWLAGDSAAAASFATPRAIAELFAHRASEIQFNSCSAFGSKYRCFFYYEGGGLNMNVEGSSTTGFLVTKAFFIAD